jgi:alkanesulfonate monooxygenase SsuD/methylene tetrahydromethanopterin reductase-like flavin-dependent oxidoreductase (luciferase family)
VLCALPSSGPDGTSRRGHRQPFQGTIVLGLGTGWDANEFANFGLPFRPAHERHAALEEALEIIRGVWGEQPFTFEGQHFRCANAHVAPLPVQHPSPPVMIAGGGERVTLRQVARSAGACNILQVDPFGDGLLSPDTVARKLTVLRSHCDDIGRPFETVLRIYTTGWMILGQNEDALQAKLARYFPKGIAERYQGTWRDYVFAATPDRAVAWFRALRDAGIQYFIVEILDAADQDTIRLLAAEVIPRVRAARD